MGMDKDRILLGWKEVADYLGCSVATAARREKDGLPVFRTGGQLRAFEDDIDNWLKGLRNTGAFGKVPDLRVESMEESEDIQGAIATVLSDKSSERIVILNLGKAKDEYEKIELLLKRVEDKYNVLVEEVPEWVWEMNSNGEFVFSNRRITEILGYLPEDVKGYNLQDFLVYKEDRFDIEKTFLSVVKDKQVIRGYLCRFSHRDNTIRYIESSWKPIFDDNGLLKGFSGISRDVTDRLQLEKDIYKNRLYLDSILENSTDPIITADQNGKIDNWNEQAETMFGYKEREIKGKNILTITNISKNASDFDGFLADIDDNGGSLLLDKLNINTKNGESISVSVLFSVVKDEGDELIGITAILINSNARKDKAIVPDTLIQTKRSNKEELS
jgi:PAS domain S-box-containing protein